MSEKKMEDHEQLLLTAVGNPNVDIIIQLENDSLIKKYDLQFDRTEIVEEKFLIKIENDFKKLNPKILRYPGGCAHNTLRIFQWLINSKFNTCMIGSVGQDAEGKFLKDELEKNGIMTSYTQKQNFKTGFIFLFIYQNKVAPVYGATCLASWQYSVYDFLADEKALEAVKESKIVLLEGFFLMHGNEVCSQVLEICSEHGVVTTFNICGEYVAKSEIIIPYIKSCNITIGNETEFKAVCKLLNIATDNFENSLKEVFDIMKPGRTAPNKHRYKLKSMNTYEKILIVTCGSDGVYCLCGSDVIQFQGPVIEKEREKDDLGAGDSFLAGFLYGILHDFPILKCLELACLLGAEIVKQRGCVEPEEMSSDLICLLNNTST